MSSNSQYNVIDWKKYLHEISLQFINFSKAFQCEAILFWSFLHFFEGDQPKLKLGKDPNIAPKKLYYCTVHQVFSFIVLMLQLCNFCSSNYMCNNFMQLWNLESARLRKDIKIGKREGIILSRWRGGIIVFKDGILYI